PSVDRPPARHVIRRRDFIDLFDTTPDLAGQDIDIDRWVREIEDPQRAAFLANLGRSQRRAPSSHRFSPSASRGTLPRSNWRNERVAKKEEADPVALGLLGE